MLPNLRSPADMQLTRIVQEKSPYNVMFGSPVATLPLLLFHEGHKRNTKMTTCNQSVSKKLKEL